MKNFFKNVLINPLYQWLFVLYDKRNFIKKRGFDLALPLDCLFLIFLLKR